MVWRLHSFSTSMNHPVHHQHSVPDYNLLFGTGVTLNIGFAVFEVICGYLAGSMALITDAGHNASDVLGLLLAWGATALAGRSPSPQRTFGMRRSSILAALFNALILLAALSAIAWEAVRRLYHPRSVEGETVIWVALAGVVVNLVTALLFVKSRKIDLNMQGAFLHMMADAAVSAGVVVTGLGLVLTGWLWLDPVASLVIVVVILIGTWQLLRDSLNLALDAVPARAAVDDIRLYLQSLPNVLEIHDLHVWAISTTEVAMTVHLVMSKPVSHGAFFGRIERELHDRCGIGHAAIQVEGPDRRHGCGCRLEVA